MVKELQEQKQKEIVRKRIKHGHVSWTRFFLRCLYFYLFGNKAKVRAWGRGRGRGRRAEEFAALVRYRASEKPCVKRLILVTKNKGRYKLDFTAHGVTKRQGN